MLVAGVMILAVHQPLVWLLHRASVTPWRGFDLTPIAPFRLPALVSAVFWGAIWGPIIAWLGRRNGLPLRHVYAAICTAVLTTVVGIVLVASGHGQRIAAASAGTAIAASLLVNGIWSFATSVAIARLGARSDTTTTV